MILRRAEYNAIREKRLVMGFSVKGFFPRGEADAHFAV